MKVVHTIKDLQAELAVLRAQGKKVGLVPTMGALHAGHASLVKRSVSENGVTVVSVFVNPTQFNDKNDLEKYPRTLDADCRLLEECGADFAFAPSVSEMYPEPDTRQFSYAPLDTVMEGAFRPGHFNGVCQIVSKLFDAVQPDRAYFGEKDFQQLAIIREMVRQLKYNLEIVGCSIVREEDGLALSIFPITNFLQCVSVYNLKILHAQTRSSFDCIFYHLLRLAHCVSGCKVTTFK